MRLKTKIFCVNFLPPIAVKKGLSDQVVKIGDST